MGHFRPAAGTPDGDSVRFEPDDPDLMRAVPGVEMSHQAITVQLRYEGIDTLEKHAIQPHATDARDANLQLLGTEGPSDPVGSRGYVLTREGDMKTRRPICFVFVGDPDETDGSSVRLEAARVRSSVNYQLLEAGMAYPLFYETLFKELRDVLVVALNNARAANPRRGHITLDQSGAGVEYSGRHNLDELPPIFPKLFRRLDGWNGWDGQTLDGFLTWLDQTENERVHTLSDGRFIGFQDALEVTGNRIRMLYAPEDMVFRPKPPGRSA
jgi:hypothetical protein